MPAKTTHKAKAIVQIDAEVKPLLDLMLKKANLSLSDLNDTFISIWVSQNKDLLTPAERQQYAHLFLHSWAIHRVFVDTNLLINDYLYRAEGFEKSRVAYDALNFLRAKPKSTLYVASFSLVQLISTLSRQKVSDAIIREELQFIVARYQLVDFTKADIMRGLNLAGRDVEDAFQYAVSQKMRCRYILTDNVKDFKG